MTYLKASIATIFILLCILTGYMFLTLDSEYQLNHASELFLKGNNREAERLLVKIESDLLPSQYQLYMAYIFREQKQLQESDQLLEEAIENENINDSNSNLLLEIYLNQAFNAYLEQNPQRIAKAVANAKEIDGNSSSWVKLFTGISEYSNQQYSKALANWQRMTEPVPMSLWMEKAFNQHFTPFWLFMKIVRANIEMGEFVKARQNLGEATLTASPEQLNEINFLFGLSYAKEAQDKPIDAAQAYYKLAFSYFKQVPMNNSPFVEERNKIADQLQNDLFTLIDQQAFENLPFYISTLENWEDNPKLTQVNERLMTVLEEEIAANNWELVQEITTILKHTLKQQSLRNSLEKRFQVLVENSLNSGIFSNLEQYWQNALNFGSSPELLTERTAALAKKKILGIIPLDDSALTLSIPYFLFWQSIELNSQQKYTFAEELLKEANVSWENQEEEKTLTLLKTSLSIVPSGKKKSLLKEIEDLVASYYKKAMLNENMQPLPYILKAVQQLKLTGIAILDKSEVEKQLEDAKTFFAEKNYQKARTKAAWVLKIDPGNQAAIEILGMTYYHEADYTKALSYLKDISSPISKVTEALAVSEILVGDPESGKNLLREFSKDHTINRETYLHLGYGSMIVNNPQDSALWLSKALPLDNEVIAGISFADYLNQHWNDSVKQFKQLTPPFNNLWGLQGAVVVSYMGVGNIGQAEEVLTKLLAINQEPNEKELSYLFNVFKNKVLDQLNRDFIAAIFYKNVKKDYAKALRYFNQIPNPSLEALLEKAEAYLALNLKEDALVALEKFQEQIKDNMRATPLHLRALSLMASLYFSQTLYPEAVRAFTNYFALDPANMTQRPLYAKSLMHLQRYDLALEQYELLKKANRLTFVPFVQSLIYTNQFDQANVQAKILLTQNPQISLFDRLKIAYQMNITGNKPLLDMALQSIPTNHQLSLKNNQELISVLSALGDYNRALKITKTIKSELEKTSSGLMTLAQLNANLSNFKEALEFAYKAKNLSPSDTHIINFISQYENRREFINQSLAELQKKITEYPNRISWQIAYARNLIDFAIENQDQGFSNSSELQQAISLLDKLAFQFQEIPEIYFLIGQTHFLLDNHASAIEYYKKALKLDLSYVEAYKYLALALQNDPYQSISLLQDALKFAPDDAEIWQQIGLLYQEQENKGEAINAFKNAIKYRPNDPITYLQIAKLYLDVNNPGEAKTALDKALVLEPNNIQALKLLLITLHDPNLNERKTNPGSLVPLQKAVYKTLFNLSPEEAESMISELS